MAERLKTALALSLFAAALIGLVAIITPSLGYDLQYCTHKTLSLIHI